MSGPDQPRVNRFRAARRDDSLVVLEGLHALKHALRFGADVLEAATPDPTALARLAGRLCPDVATRAAALAEPVAAATFDALAPRPPATGVIALARRPAVTAEAVIGERGGTWSVLHAAAAARACGAELAARPKGAEDAGAAPAAGGAPVAHSAPVVVLDHPAHLGNIGAAVRVAAAAGAAGLLSVGPHDPWSPDAVRGAAGLQFALPVTRADALPATERPILALDPDGEALRPGSLPDDALLLFGSERGGLGAELLRRADARIGIPMRPGVSSLNLATAVAVVLYAWRLGRG